MNNSIKYPFVIRPLSKEDGGDYLITFPDLPGCMSDGETIEEAIENGLDAVNSWIETAKEFGDQIPEPESGLKRNIVDYILPENLHQNLVDLAKEESRSINALVTSFIAEGLSKRRLVV